MGRTGKDSDRNVLADPPATGSGAQSLADLLDRSEIIELFDEAIRLRFGRIISETALASTKHRSGRPR